MAMSREARLADAFVELADTLAEEFSVVDLVGLLVRHCVELLGARGVAVLLADKTGDLELVASSDEKVRLVETFALHVDEGPGRESFRACTAVSATDLRDLPDQFGQFGQPDPTGQFGGSAQPTARRWPRFASGAAAAGFRSAYSVPLCHGDGAVGVLDLFCADPDPGNEDDLRLAQALADVATISILRERRLRSAQGLSDQLQAALDSRVVIEQAKGILAERAGLPIDEAFLALRGYARSRQLRLTGVAHQVVQGTIDSAPMLSGSVAARNR